MNPDDPPADRPALSARRAAGSGALAAAVSVLVFTAVHHWLISDIWYSLLPMTVAGLICGAAVAWSYARLFGRRLSLASWVGYNMLWVGLLVGIGLVSVLVFEPVVSAAEILATGEAPPPELLRSAAPLTLAFIVLAAAGVGLAWGRSLLDHLSVLLTSTALLVLLGINLSILGLVSFTSGTLPLLAMNYGLVVLLNAVFALLFATLHWRALSRTRVRSAGAGHGGPSTVSPRGRVTIRPASASATGAGDRTRA